MPLAVWTARISTKDSDAFDVTRKSGNPTFAPSWKILGPMLDIRRVGRKATEEEWRNYARDYFEEMRASYRSDPTPWKTLLAKERVVLTCYCTNAFRCHRTLLGKFLVKLGAEFFGEVTERDAFQAELFEFAMGLGND